MIRRKNSRDLRRAGLEATESLDPISGLVNLVDCMLVLAVGLMIALVAHYGVNLASQDTTVSANKVEIALDAKDPDGNNLYEDLGHTYRDTETGTLYFVEKGDQ